MKILCKLGMHKWKYNKFIEYQEDCTYGSDSKGRPLLGQRTVKKSLERMCLNCGLYQKRKYVKEQDGHVCDVLEWEEMI